MAIELGALLTILLVVGFLAQWLAWRMRLPAILFLVRMLAWYGMRAKRHRVHKPALARFRIQTREHRGDTLQQGMKRPAPALANLPPKRHGRRQARRRMYSSPMVLTSFRRAMDRVAHV